MPILVDVEEIAKARKGRKRKIESPGSELDWFEKPKKYRIEVFNVRDSNERSVFERLVNDLLSRAQKQEVTNIQIRDYSDTKGNIIKTVEWIEIMSEEEDDD